MPFTTRRNTTLTQKRLIPKGNSIEYATNFYNGTVKIMTKCLYANFQVESREQSQAQPVQFHGVRSGSTQLHWDALRHGRAQICYHRTGQAISVLSSWRNSGKNFQIFQRCEINEDWWRYFSLDRKNSVLMSDSSQLYSLWTPYWALNSVNPFKEKTFNQYNIYYNNNFMHFPHKFMNQQPIYIFLWKMTCFPFPVLSMFIYYTRPTTGRYRFFPLQAPLE